MKNIHVLPTGKPSNLCINGKNFQNIYITSDEGIKEGDWVITNNGLLAKVVTELTWHFINSKKIILTTDQDLIKDGVQSINDEFLEWFIKNPSCEYVPIIPPLFGHGYIIWFDNLPKKEPKQETLEEAAEIILLGEDLDLSDYDKRYILKAMVNIAKWQAERMYSEEDMTNYALYILHNNVITPKEWFEQFKKK